MSVRLLCIDVGTADDALAASAVTRAVAMASSLDRLLCFGASAVIAARLDKQERAEREGVWLDVAASWMLSPGALSSPPQRPQPGPLQSRALVVGKAGLDVGGLQVTQRHVEMYLALLLMAVPSRADIVAVDNAHVWLVGGQPFAVERPASSNGRCIVSVGGAIVGITLDKSDVNIEHWDLAGHLMSSTSVALGGSNRMSVQGSP